MAGRSSSSQHNGGPRRSIIGGNGTTSASRANPLPVIGASGFYGTASFTPAAAAYLANDVMGASAEFAFTFGDGTAIPAGSLVRILTAITRIDVTGLTGTEGAYALQGYSVTQPSAQADNDAWALASGDLTTYRGAIPLGTPVDLGAALYVKSSGIDQDVRLITSSLWGRLITVAGFTATAVARQVTLYGIVL